MLTTTLLLAASMIAGQANGEQAFKSYAEFMAGGTWTRSVDGTVHKHSYQLILDGKYMQTTTEGGDFAFTAITGVDPKSQKAVTWWFTNRGGMGRSTVTQEADGVWLTDGEASGPQGTFLWRTRSKRIDKDTLEVEWLKSNLDGVDNSLETVTWKRKR